MCVRDSAPKGIPQVIVNIEEWILSGIGGRYSYLSYTDTAQNTVCGFRPYSDPSRFKWWVDSQPPINVF